MLLNWSSWKICQRECRITTVLLVDMLSKCGRTGDNSKNPTGKYRVLIAGALLLTINTNMAVFFFWFMALLRTFTFPGQVVTLLRHILCFLPASSYPGIKYVIWNVCANFLVIFLLSGTKTLKTFSRRRERGCWERKINILYSCFLCYEIEMSSLAQWF